MTVVIVKKGEKLSGFLVDSLIGQQEIVIKSLGKLLSNIKELPVPLYWETEMLH